MQIPHWMFSEYSIHLTIILSAFILTYAKILGKDFFWTIDDLAGIADFSEKWNDKEQKKIDSYNLN